MFLRITLIGLLAGVPASGLYSSKAKRHWFDATNSEVQLQDVIQKFHDDERTIKPVPYELNAAKNPYVEAEKARNSILGAAADTAHRLAQEVSFMMSKLKQDALRSSSSKHLSPAFLEKSGKYDVSSIPEGPWALTDDSVDARWTACVCPAGQGSIKPWPPLALLQKTSKYDDDDDDDEVKGKDDEVRGNDDRVKNDHGASGDAAEVTLSTAATRRPLSLVSTTQSSLVSDDQSSLTSDTQSLSTVQATVCPACTALWNGFDTTQCSSYTTTGSVSICVVPMPTQQTAQLAGTTFEDRVTMAMVPPQYAPPSSATLSDDDTTSSDTAL